MKFDQTIKLENANSSIARLTTQDQDVVVLTVSKILAIDPRSVTFKSWSESSSSRRKLASSSSRTIFATTSVQASSLLFPGFDSSDTMGIYNYLVEKIVAAVNSGTFTSTMQSFAVQYGSSALSTCTATSVSVSALSVTTPGKDSPPEFSEPEVTGIIVAAVFALLLIVIALIYNYSVSNTLAKKLQKRAQNIFFGVPKFQKMYSPEHAVKIPSASVPPSELPSLFDVFSQDIEVGSMKRKPLVIPSNAKDSIVVVDEVLPLGSADAPDRFLLRDKIFLHVVDKNRPPQQRFRKPPPPPPPPIKVEAVVHVERETARNLEQEMEEEHKEDDRQNALLNDGGDSATAIEEDNDDDMNSLVTEELPSNENFDGEQSLEEFVFDSDADKIASSPCLPEISDDEDLTSNNLQIGRAHV